MELHVPLVPLLVTHYIKKKLKRLWLVNTSKLLLVLTKTVHENKIESLTILKLFFAVQLYTVIMNAKCV